tara:strand:+ start:115 stop:543 length:429 start_codon:yes stop_codon:yes gene_type:complete
MSYYDTKQALLQQLSSITITGITSADIAYENSVFDPSNKSKFISATFIPATSEMMGKTSTSSDDQRGILQVSVFVKLNSGNYDNTQLQIVDSIITGFIYNAVTVYNGQTVQILDSTVNSGSENEAWFKRDISINYLTFSNRG